VPQVLLFDNPVLSGYIAGMRYLTIRQLADRWDCTRQNLDKNYIAKGKISTEWIGNQRVVRLSDVSRLEKKFVKNV